MPLARRLVIALSLSLPSLLLGCGSDGSSNVPVVTIVKPANGAAIASTAGRADISVEFTVSNFKLEPPSGQPVVAGVGHCHLFLDGGAAYVAAGVSPLVVPGVATGPHTLRLEVHNSDHTLASGISPATMTLTVQ